MAKKSNKEEFVERSKIVHKDSLYKYFYDSFKYVNNKIKGTITCEKHGDFQQSPNSHLRGSGCPECKKEKIGDALRGNLEKFTEKAKIAHKDSLYKQTYDKFVYVNACTKGFITCEKHGDYEQTPANHLSGHGCPKCAIEYRSDLFKKNLEEFIQQAKIIHKNSLYEYTYDKFVYINSDTKGIITCKKHGDFEQRPSDHLRGKGCPECWRERLRNRNRIRWSDRYDEGILYLIECWNDVERFVKIGVTSKTVEERYKQVESMPYQYKILKEIQMDSITVSNTEQHIIKFYNSYKPSIQFAGDSECLEIFEKYQIIEFLENLENLENLST